MHSPEPRQPSLPWFMPLPHQGGGGYAGPDGAACAGPVVINRAAPR